MMKGLIAEIDFEDRLLSKTLNRFAGIPSLPVDHCVVESYLKCPFDFRFLSRNAMRSFDQPDHLLDKW